MPYQNYNPDVSGPGWNWNPMSAFVVAKAEADANARAQAELAFKQQESQEELALKNRTVPSEIAKNQAMAGYYGQKGDYYDSKGNKLPPPPIPVASSDATSVGVLSDDQLSGMGLPTATPVDASSNASSETAPSADTTPLPPDAAAADKAYLQANPKQGSVTPQDLQNFNVNPNNPLIPVIAPNGGQNDVLASIANQLQDPASISDVAPVVTPNSGDARMAAVGSDATAIGDTGLTAGQVAAIRAQGGGAKLNVPHFGNGPGDLDITSGSPTVGMAASSVLAPVSSANPLVNLPDAAPAASTPQATPSSGLGSYVSKYAQTQQNIQSQLIKAQTDIANNSRLANNPAFYKQNPTSFIAARQALVDAQEKASRLQTQSAALRAQFSSTHGVDPQNLDALQRNPSRVAQYQKLVDNGTVSNLNEAMQFDPKAALDQAAKIQTMINNGGNSPMQNAALFKQYSHLISVGTGVDATDAPTADPTGITSMQDVATKLSTAAQEGVKTPLVIGGVSYTPDAKTISDLSSKIKAQAIASGVHFDPSNTDALDAFNQKSPKGTPFMLRGDNAVHFTNPDATPSTLLAQQKREPIAPDSGSLWKTIAPKTVASIQDPAQHNFHDQSNAVLQDLSRPELMGAVIQDLSHPELIGAGSPLWKANAMAQNPLLALSAALESKGIAPTLENIKQYFTDPGSTSPNPATP